MACPRLSIDWGTNAELMHKPLLTPYELQVCMELENETPSSPSVPEYSTPKGWIESVKNNKNCLKNCDKNESTGNDNQVCGCHTDNTNAVSTTMPQKITIEIESDTPTEDSYYPMDFYSHNAGPWGNMYHRK